jgi:hypothetical protein
MGKMKDGKKVTKFNKIHKKELNVQQILVLQVLATLMHVKPLQILNILLVSQSLHLLIVLTLLLALVEQ